MYACYSLNPRLYPATRLEGGKSLNGDLDIMRQIEKTGTWWESVHYTYTYMYCTDSTEMPQLHIPGRGNCVG